MGARGIGSRKELGGAGTVRLDRALSKLGLASRSEARSAIAEGLVTVRGEVERDAGRLVDPVTDEIRLSGQGAVARARRVLALHKPRGVVTTRSDPERRRTVFDLLGEDAEGLLAVGRLDLATSGLLLLTTDPRLADRLTDPKNAVPRIYLVTVRGDVSEETARRMEAGIEDRGETLRATSLTVRKRSKRESHLVMVLAEGKNREIRRICDAAGHEVTRLRRVAFGSVELGELPAGEWRELTAAEVAKLESGSGGSAEKATRPGEGPE